MDKTDHIGFDSGPWIPLLRQWHICCIVALGGLLASVMVIESIEPLYKAEIQIVLPLRSLENPAANGPDQALQADPLVVRSFSEIMQNDAICQEVIDSLDLTHNAEFLSRQTWLDQAKNFILDRTIRPVAKETAEMFTPSETRADALLQDYKSRLDVTDSGRSLVLDLSFQAHDARLARAVVDAHARAFVKNEVAHFRQVAETKSAWMKSEVDRMTADMRAAQVALQVGSHNTASEQDRTGAGVAALRMRESVAKTTLDVYAAVMKKYQDLIANENYRGTDIRIISSAMLPTRPFYPKKNIMLPLAALIWLIIGIMSAGVAAILNGRLGAQDKIRDLGVPILGLLHVPVWPRAILNTRRNVLRKRFFWEEIHEILITFRITTRRHPIILVTSAVQLEGKSLIVSALARKMASSGLRTLVIDVNARNRHYELTKCRDGAFPRGLESVFSGTMPARHAAIKVDVASPLFYLSANSANSAIYAMPESKLRSAFVAMKRDFDVIFIDCPALDGLSDALRLGTIADEIVIASLAVKGNLNALKETIAKLAIRALPLKGIVLVDGQPASRADYGKLSSYETDHNLTSIWPKESKPRLSNHIYSFIPTRFRRRGLI